jgi:hypothetical protein
MDACRFLLNKTIDAVLYVDRLDGYRVDNLDRQVIRAIHRSFGPIIWRLAIVVLTHAQLSPPDGVEYSEFLQRRSEGLQAAIRQEAGFKKSEDPVRLLSLAFFHEGIYHKPFVVVDILCFKSNFKSTFYVKINCCLTGRSSWAKVMQ